MAKNFDTEKREVFDSKYLKVFLRDEGDMHNIANLLQGLKSVKKANITKQRSGNVDFTIYPNRVYDIDEVNEEVRFAITNYYNGSPVDPSFITDAISEISDKAYFQIIDYILRLGKELEAFKALNVRFDEERYRDYFLAFLNSISRNHTAKGEVFNRNGKTDIMMFDHTGNNLFIAECKIWKGQKLLTDAIDQLLQNYVNWRDEKVAIIIFNRDVIKFSDVIDTAVSTTKDHPLCFDFLGQRADTSFSYIFNHPNDVDKKIQLELILLNFT